MNIQSTPVVRRATQSDAAELATLINIAGEGIPNWLWTQSCVEGQTPLDVGTERAKRSTVGFSYSNALIAQEQTRILGMVLSYAISHAPEEDPDTLPDPIAPFVALEKRSVGTWYVNALAVFSDNRGIGTGTRLMSAAETAAIENGFATMSIQVYEQNTGAVRLYRRLGYALVAQAAVRKHPSPPFYTGNVLLLKKSLG